MMPERDPLGPVERACLHLFGRVGATSFQIRYSEERPVVWTAVVEIETVDGEGVEAAAAASPAVAIVRLADQLVDGASCVHCDRITLLEHDWTTQPTPDEAASVCFYKFDPELEQYRRSCVDMSTLTVVETAE